jgi:hypothetical protein
MTTSNSFEINVLPRTDDQWDIVDVYYEAGRFHLEFKDGTVGAIVTGYGAISNLNG